MKNALNICKNNNGPNLNKQNSQLLNLSLAIEEVFQVHSQKRPVANIPFINFRSQSREMSLPKLLNTQLSVFSTYFGFLPSIKV